MKRRSPKRSTAPKRVLRLPDLDHAKLAVLNTLGSPASQYSYRFAIDDFITWYCAEPRIVFNKTVVCFWRYARRGGLNESKLIGIEEHYLTLDVRLSTRKGCQ